MLNFEKDIFSTDDSRNSGRKVSGTIIPGKNSQNFGIPRNLSPFPVFLENVVPFVTGNFWIFEPVFFIDYVKCLLLKETCQTFQTYC